MFSLGRVVFFQFVESVFPFACSKAFVRLRVGAYGGAYLREQNHRGSTQGKVPNAVVQ